MLNRILSRLKKDSVVTATVAQKDNEIFVANCIAKNGAAEFANASDRLKSDAKFVLGLVKTCPECLNSCADVLFDRYVQDGEMIEQPVDNKLFAALCCEENVEAFKYLAKIDARQYLQDAQ